MPAPFSRISIQEFASLLKLFRFTRSINAVHMHHTWRPNHSQYRGHETIVGMWRHHTQQNGWRDIAQHVTIDPDGGIWLGRNWNLPPASAAGSNGNDRFGPFMFEMIGDFDKGRDAFEGNQREAALMVTALVQRRFNLIPETLRFHRSMSNKTCPGSAIEFDDVLGEVRRMHEDAMEMLARSEREQPRGDGPFGPEAIASDTDVSRLLDTLSREIPGWEDVSNAEPAEEAAWLSTDGAEAVSRNGEDARPRELSPQMLAALRPHVINMRQGVFSEEGQFSTAPEDVDALFQEHLAAELDAARARDEKLRLLFYAHGGLVSESNALRSAHRRLSWWKKNGVYPVYFVWETGLFETIRQLLEDSRARVPRDIWDLTTDRVVEAAARALYGPQIWNGMKRSAERASADQGAARYAARRLKELCDGGDVELHAVGHSAGSIFHSHFIPAALDEGCSAFKSVHFLAPAVRVDTFLQELAPRLGDGVEQLAVYTMKKDLERADNCAGIYRKSLLYLVHRALESERKADLLGLEVSLRRSPETRRLFGLGGTRSDVAEVIWSETTLRLGRSASTSSTHGGFDEDAPTMNSVLRRVLDIDDTDPITEFPRALEARTLYPWIGQIDWPEELWDLIAPPATLGTPSPVHHSPVKPAAVVPQTPVTPSGRRRALCIGIDRYPTAPLYGCVADARLWQAVFTHLGFEQPVLLTNEDATRAAILEALADIVDDSQAGDVVAFQFSGHGTQLPDLDGDEAGGDAESKDEALCAYDFAAGAFVIDDDVAQIFERIRDGVSLTCFIDCCHSGTISRLGIGTPSDRAAHRGDSRPRFIAATPEMRQAHRRFRQARGARGDAVVPRGPETMRETLFSACLSTEVAWESNGQGDFTSKATEVLRSGTAGMTNEAFLDRVRDAFGPAPRQHPDLDCAPAMRGRGLLQPVLLQPGANGSVHSQGAPSAV